MEWMSPYAHVQWNHYQEMSFEFIYLSRFIVQLAHSKSCKTKDGEKEEKLTHYTEKPFMMQGKDL
jgi:hypothetical protein